MNDNAHHKNYEHDIFNMQVSFQMFYSVTRLYSLMSAVEDVKHPIVQQTSALQQWRLH